MSETICAIEGCNNVATQELHPVAFGVRGILVCDAWFTHEPRLKRYAQSRLLGMPSLSMEAAADPHEKSGALACGWRGVDIGASSQEAWTADPVVHPVATATEILAARCDHRGVGLPGCVTCDPVAQLKKQLDFMHAVFAKAAAERDALSIANARMERQLATIKATVREGEK